MQNKLIEKFKNTDRREKFIIFFLITVFVTMTAWIVQQYVRVNILNYRFFNGTTWGSRETDYFMDFFNVNYWTQKGVNPYTSKFRSSYPPLILAISKFFTGFADYSGGSVAARETVAGMASYQIAFVVCTLLSCVAWFKMLEKSSLSVVKKLMLSLSMIITAPYLYLYGRGNYIFIVVTAISWFLAWYKSEKRWQREFSLMFLAVAAGIKLYPALLAAVLLREKRYVDFIKTVIYTLAAFFLPFLAFSGGFGNISVFLDNLSSFQGSGQVSTRNYSIATFLYYFIQFKNGFRVGDVPQWIVTVGGKIATVVLLAGVSLSLFAKKTWKALALITIALIVYPAPSFVYSATMMLPVVLLFLADEEKSKFDYCYLVLFLMMLIPVQFGYLVSPEVFKAGISINNFMQHVAMITAFGLLSLGSIRNVCKKISDRVHNI